MYNATEKRFFYTRNQRKEQNMNLEDIYEFLNKTQDSSPVTKVLVSVIKAKAEYIKAKSNTSNNPIHAAHAGQRPNKELIEFVLSNISIQAATAAGHLPHFNPRCPRRAATFQQRRPKAAAVWQRRRGEVSGW